MTFEEMLYILNTEELSDRERSNLELLLQGKSEEALKEFSKNKEVHIKLVFNIDDLIDGVDISERMMETGSTNVESLALSILEERIQDLPDTPGNVEYEIK